ncbi:carboxypeptidase-like regulatory domain-containing protein [Desertivirga xinjiangensis]|uniref:carboxypeptidase-like regulatory domain-containing protein n=1 Tax=Desertivirga xinjiangensis TaxID=539206 RepID=UPI002108EEAA|nr:carboxypeptidase-like regulatory domain-containing protein [Pedobacter xinjiangensis]
MQKVLDQYNSIRFIRSKLVLVLFLFFKCSSLLYANSFNEQNIDKIKIDFVIRDASIAQSFLALERQSGVQISFLNQLVSKEKKKVSIDQKGITVGGVLRLILDRTNLDYKLVRDYVVIEEKIPVQPPKVLKGKVTDLKGSSLPGVSIKSEGKLRSTVTDINGLFSIPAELGDKLVFQFLGFETRVLTYSGEQQIIVQLKESNQGLKEVVIHGRRSSASDVALLSDRRKSTAVQDGISSEGIAKAGSINTSEALQRVVGVSVSDGKYVAIRGLSDRNIVAQLNGARLSTANADRSAVPLDLIPATLLDNISVIKTLTPDKPADATAGVVELKTKSIPERLTINIIASSGLNNRIGAGGSYTSFEGSDLGSFGQLAGKRNLPGEFKDLRYQYMNVEGGIQSAFKNSANSPGDFQEALRINRLMEDFDPVLTTSLKKAEANQLYSFTIGNNYTVLDRKLGVILGANYFSRTDANQGGEFNTYSFYGGAATGGYNTSTEIPDFITPNNIKLLPYQSYKEHSGTQQVTYGGLAALAYKISEQHEVSAHYVGTKGAEATGMNMIGGYPSSNLISEKKFSIGNQIYNLRTTERDFHTLQLKGEHKLGKGASAWRFNWNASGSNALQNDPDFRSVNLVIDTNQIYEVNRTTYPEYSFPDGDELSGRYFRNMKEKNRNYFADLSREFKVNNDLQINLKFGYFFLKRSRNYNEQVLGLPDAGQLMYLNGDLNALVSPGNIGIREGAQGAEGTSLETAHLYNIKPTRNNYTGSQKVDAMYQMIDLRYLDKFQLVGGVRFEQTLMRGDVDTVGIGIDQTNFSKLQKDSLSGSLYNTGFKPFWSGTFIYRHNAKMNFRAAYSRTLQRPEIREFVPTTQFDAFENAFVKGNRELINSSAQNLDFRWEWFPSLSDVLSISVFYKKIENQLEKVFSGPAGVAANGPAFTPSISYQNNTETGRVMGFEFEVQKNLGLLGRGMRNFSINASLMLANSSVKLNKDRLNSARLIDRYAPDKSPVFEQPPYVINTSVSYDNKKLGSVFNLQFNQIGERLVEVQLNGGPDVYEQPAGVLDAVIKQKIFKGLQLTGFAKNILDPDFKRVYAKPGRGGRYGTYNEEYVRRKYRRGAEFMLGLNYNF